MSDSASATTDRFPAGARGRRLAAPLVAFFALVAALLAVGASPAAAAAPTLGQGWSLRQSAADQAWFSVAYGNGLFVAVAYDSGVMTSPDGITWTSQSSANDDEWHSVVY